MMSTHKEKRHILQISGIGVGGIENLVTRIIRDLKSETLNFAMYTSPTDEISNKKLLEDMGIDIKYSNSYNKVYSIRYMIELYKELKENDYNVVHSHNLFSSGINMFIAWLAKVPIRISHAHNTKSNTKDNFIRKIYENSMRLLINIFSTDLVAVSEEAAKFVFGKTSLKDKRLKIIFNGIDLEKFNKSKYNKQEVCKELNINEKRVNFVSVARFAVQKNHKFMVDIFYELVKKQKDIHLTFVGDGELKKEVEEYVYQKKMNENITFLGSRKEIAKILSAMDYFILPSMWEGFGIVYLEAQAMGLHCFASNCIPKVADAGNISFISLEKNAEEWAEEILLMHKKAYKEKNGQSYLIKNFDVKIMENKISDIYEREI